MNIELHQHRDHFAIKAASQKDYFNRAELGALVRDFSQNFLRIVNEPSAHVLPHLPIDDEQLPLTNGVNHDAKERSASIPADVRVSSFLAILSACVDAPPNSLRPDTPLITLGVDSITAIHISSKAREAGLQLHASDILRCQTPEDVIQVLESKATRNEVQRLSDPRLSADERDAVLTRISAPKDSVQEILPASAGMEWLIGMWQLSDRARFQHVFAFKLPADIDEDVLRSAWYGLVQKHPILRSTFVSTTGKDVSVVVFRNPSEERLWSHQDLSTESMGIAEGVAEEMVSNPLTTDQPPCRAVLLSLRDSKILLLHLHHFQYDAWGLRLLANDLKSLYQGNGAICSGNLSSFLGNCNTDYFKEEQMRYWRDYLPVPFTPALLPRCDRTTTTECERLVHTDHQALRSISRFREQAQKLSLSLNVLFLASWARAQAKFSGADSATFGLWHLGRSGVVDDVDSLPIPCMNVLPVHADCLNASVITIADRIQKTLRHRSAIVEQSHLLDVDRWTGGNGTGTMMNVFVNVVATAELDKGDNSFLELLEVGGMLSKYQRSLIRLIATVLHPED